LPDVAGDYTVYAWFRDNNGNETVEPATDSITVELTAPTNGTVSRTVLGDTSASISWTGYSDSQSGIASYKVVYAVSSTAPADCDSGTTAYTGSALTTTMTGLTAGATYAVRVCAIDAAGNMSTGSTVTATTTDHVGPTGTVVINSGASYTKTTASTLTISASDPSGVSTMCVSNTTTCTTYTAYTTSRAWTLTTGAGTKTVYVKFKDSKGNISTATTDTIIVDATAPTNGTLLGTASTGQIALSWSGFSDASSGIASYKVVYSTSTTAPASCSAGTVLYAGTSTSVTHSSTVAGRTYRYRACAIDNAGNQSTGATRNVVGR
jgi:large repetitive protein